MEIPPELVAKTLSGFSVCYFKNTTHDPEAPPHYHITVPINDNSYLLLCMITSQVKNKAWYYRTVHKGAETCLVSVNKDNFKFLDKDSVIDCNQPILEHKNKFNMIVDPDHKFEVITRKVPKEIKEKIIKAIKDSPIVKPFIKKMIKWP